MFKSTNASEVSYLLKKKLMIKSKLTAADIVNKCSLQTMIGAKGVKGAVHLTRKATPARIRRDMNKRYHAWTFQGKSHSVKVLYLMASKSLTRQGIKFKSFGQWNALVAQESQRIYSARSSSCAFIAAGWLSCAREVGGHGGDSASGRLKPSGIALKPGGRASRGSFRRATPRNLVAIAYNVAVEGKHGGNDPDAYAIAQTGLDLAQAANIADMEKYIVRKELEALLDEASDS